MREVPKPSITALFEHYGSRVIGRGNWQKAECPLPDHDDKTPSASLNEDECRWRCFTCDAGGDAIDLILEVEGRDIGWAAARKIAEGFLGEGDSPLPPGGGSSSLLPHRKGNRQGRRNVSQPWLRL